MPKDHESMTDEQLLKWINDAMSEPAEHPEDDIGIQIDMALTYEHERRRVENKYIRGYRIELIGTSKPEVIYRPLPKPPYRCVCGIVFTTAQELLDHRHEPTKVSSW